MSVDRVAVGPTADDGPRPPRADPTRADQRSLWAAALASALGVAAYLAAAQLTYRLGFPLDDAWIHQVYARNLALHGEWAFSLGEPSGGSTSPLWGGVLALGYLLGLPQLVWAYLVGGVLLAASGWLAARWLGRRLPGRRGLAWLAALAIPLEWHLVWAALSGMETLAFGALALLCSYRAEGGQTTRPELLGALIGAGVWLRPEALLLLVIPIGQLAVERRRQAPRQLARLAAGAVLPIAGYLVLQRLLSGQWWPNTLYAKQAEYQALQEIPLAVRFLTQLGVPGAWLGAPDLAPGGPLIGLLLVLLPGLAITIVDHVRRQRWSRLLPLVWCALQLGAYAYRLPVTYQHGRYALVTLPVLLVLSLEGMLAWVDFRDRRRWHWVSARAWLAVVALVGVAFWGLGARAYARDVAIIESEMVETARWLERNTAAHDLIAVHDIGAIGYFSQRPLLDLAGLVSPEVIPFIREQAALAAYLDRRQAQYLVTFPGWYPQLVRGRPLAHTTDGAYAPAAGGENMAVYLWNSSSFAP